MSKLSLNIHFVNENDIKKMKFLPTQTIGEIIKEISAQSNIDSGGYGLFQNGADRKRWLSVDKTLESYSISTGTTLEFKKKSKTVKVNFPDNSLRTFQIDGNSKLSDVINLICEKLQLSNAEEFSLKRENGPNNVWLNLESTIDEVGIGEKDVLLFRKRFFASDNYIDTSEPTHLHLLYSQCSEAIKSCELQCSESEGINLAAIQLQINFGDNISSSTKIDISDYLPKEFSKVKNIEKRILKKQKYYAGLSQIDAKYEYVKLCRSLKYYGVTFFEAIDKSGKKERQIRIGIKRDGIIVLDILTENILFQYRFSEIKRYSSTKDKITFDFGDYLNEYITFYTDKAHLIVLTIEGYINILIKKRTTIKPYYSVHKRLNELLYYETLPFDLIQYKMNGINQHEYKIPPLDTYSGSELCKQIIASAQVIFEHMKIQENGISEDDPKSFGKIEFFSGKHRSFLLNCDIESDIEALSTIIQNRSMEKIDPIIKSMIHKIADMNSAVYNASALKDSHANKLHYNISKMTSVFIRLIQVISKLIDEYNPSETEVYKMISRLSKSIKSLKKQIIPVMAHHTINTSIVLSVHNLLRILSLFEQNFKDNPLFIDEIISVKNILTKFSNTLNQLNQFIASRHIKQSFLKIAEEVKQKLEQLKSLNDIGELKINLDISILISEEIEQLIQIISNDRVSSPVDEIIMISVDIIKIISQILNPIEQYISEDYFHILHNYLKSFQKLYIAVHNSIDKKHFQEYEQLTNLILLEKDYFENLIDNNSIMETSFNTLKNKCQLLKYCFSQIVRFFGIEPTKNIMMNYLLESIIHFKNITFITFENRNILFDSTRKKIERTELKCRRQILQYLKCINTQNENEVNEELIRIKDDYENIIFCFISLIRYSCLNMDNRDYFNIKRAIERIENNLENIKYAYDYLIMAYYYDKSMNLIRKIGKDQALIEKQAEVLQLEPSVRNTISHNFYEIISNINKCIKLVRESPEFFMDNLKNMIKNGLSFTERFITILKTTKDKDKAKKRATMFINFYDLLRSTSLSLLNLNISKSEVSNSRDSIINIVRLIKCLYKIKSLEQKANYHEDSRIIAGNLSDILFNFYEHFDSSITIQTDNRNINIEDELDNFIYSIERLETFYSMDHKSRIRKEIINLSINCANLTFNISERMGHYDHNSSIDISDILKYSSKSLELISLYASPTHLSAYLNEFILYLHKVKSILYSNQDSKYQFVHMLSVLSYDMKKLSLRKLTNSPNSVFDIIESCNFIHNYINQYISSPQKNNSYILMEIYLKLRDLASTLVSRITSDKILSSYITLKNVLASILNVSKSNKNELKRKAEYLYEQLEVMKESIYKSDHKLKDKFLREWKRYEKKVLSLRKEIDKVLDLNIYDYESSNKDKVITYDHIKKENEMIEVLKSLHQKAKYYEDELNGLVNKFIPVIIIYELSIKQTKILILSLSKYISNNKNNHFNSFSFKREIDESIAKLITLEKHIFKLNNVEPVTSYIQTIDTCIELANEGRLMEFSVKEMISLNDIIERWIQFFEDGTSLSFIPGGDFLNTFVDSVISASQTFVNKQIELLDNAKKCLLILEQNQSESIYNDLVECLSSFKSIMEMDRDSSLHDSIIQKDKEEEKNEEKINEPNQKEDNEKENNKKKDGSEINKDSNNKMSSNILSDVSLKVKSVIGSFLQEIKVTDSDQKDRNEEIRSQWSRKVEEISMMARISKLERKLEQAKMEYPSLNQSENVM